MSLNNIEINNGIKKTFEIEGVYGDKAIKIESYPIIGNPNLLLNIHGAFGTLNGYGNKYVKLASNVLYNDLGSSVLYESSRNRHIDEDIHYKGSIVNHPRFIGKGFEGELNDARRVLVHCLKNSKDLFGVNPEDLNISLNGSSLGGIIAFYLASEFPQIKRISTCGTGLRLSVPDESLKKEFPNENSIIEKLKLFKGDFLFFYGTSDQVFSENSFEDFFSWVINGNNYYQRFLGVDHSFCNIGGKKSDLPISHINNQIISFLQGRDIKNSTINFADTLGGIIDITNKKITEIV